MNIMSNGSFLDEMNASNKQEALVKSLTSAWEKKNSKVARAGGVSLMALTLAACGGSDDTPFSQVDVDAAVTAANAAAAAEAAAAATAAAASEAAAVAAAEATAAEAATAAATAAAASEAAAVAAAEATAAEAATAAATAAAASEAAAVAAAEATATAAAEAAAAADIAAANAAKTTAEAAAATAATAQAAAETAQAAAETAQATAEAARDVALADKATAETAQAAAETAKVAAEAAKVAAENATAIAEAAKATAEASLATLQTTYDALLADYNELLDPASATYTLTTGTDGFSGGSASDSFIGSSTTFDSDDVLDGKDGDDTLTLTSAGNSSVIANISNIETVTITNSGTHATDYALNMVSASGVDAIVSRTSSGDVSVSNVQNTVSLEAFNTSGTLGGSIASVSATIATNVVSGTSEEVTLTANAGAVAEFNVTGVDTNEGYETINLVSAGSTANSVQIGSTTAGLASTVNISGAADLTLAETATADAGTINAVDMTGALTTTLDAKVDSFTGGSGNDQITVTAGELGSSNAARSYDGGAGEDTFFIAADLAAADFTAANSGTHTLTAEILDADISSAADGSADAARAIDVANVGSLTTVVSTITSADTTGDHDAVLNVTGLSSSVTVDVTGVDGESNANAGAVLSVALEDASGAADGVSIEADGTFEEISTGDTSDDTSTSSVDEEGSIETINISSSAVDADGDALTLSVATLVSDTVTTVNVSGSNAVTISAVDLVQASGANGNATSATDRAAEAVTFNSNGSALLTLASDEANTLVVNGGAGGIDLTLGGTATDAATDETLTVTGGSSTSDRVTLTDTTGTAQTVDATISGVETIEVATTGSGTNIYDMANVTGANTIEITGGAVATLDNVNGETVKIVTGTSDVDYSDIVLTAGVATGVTNTTFEIGGTMGATGQGVADLLDAAVLTTDSGKITVNDTAVLYDGTAKANEFLNHAYDIAGVASTAKVTSLVITGGGDTDAATDGVQGNTHTLVDNTNTALASIDASGFAGNLDITALGDLTDATVTMGSGDNTVTAGESQLAFGLTAAKLSSLVGGTGDDTLVVNSLGTVSTHQYTIAASGVETIDLDLGDDADDQLANTTISLANSTGVETIKLSVDIATSSADAEVFDEALTIQGVENNTTLVLGSADTNQTTYGGASDDMSIAGRSGATTLSVNNTGATGAVVVGNSAGLALGSTFTTVNVDNTAAADKALTLTTLDGSGLTAINLAAATTGATGALTVAAIDAASTETLTIDSGVAAVTVSNLGTMNSLETLTVDTGDATASAKSTITAGTSTSIDTITASGSGAFEITALTAASLDSIDAASVTGVVTIGTASAALTTAAGASIESGTGDDFITMSTANSLVLTAGEKNDTSGNPSDNDTLKIVGTMNSGTGVVNLALTDQVTSLNGFADTAAQSEFESVDLSAVTSTGSHGFQVTAAAQGSTIVGSGYNDTIYGGADTDSIDGGDGVDTIVLGVDGATDTIVVNSTEASLDTVTSFNAAATNADVLDIAGTGVASATGDSDIDVSGASGMTGTVAADVATGGIMTIVGTGKATADTLVDYIDAAELVLKAGTGTIDSDSSATASLAFEFGGDTYVVTGTTTDSGGTESYATDSVIALEDVTSITALSTTAAAATIDIM